MGGRKGRQAITANIPESRRKQFVVGLIKPDGIGVIRVKTNIASTTLGLFVPPPK